MLQSFFEHANYWAILTAAAAYFVVGSLWFSLLFGNTWSKEVAKYGVQIKEPTGKEISQKMIQTFIGNIIGALAIAILVYLTGISGWSAGLKLGLLCGFGFAASAIVIAYTWESRSFKLMAIDFGYPVVGFTACAIILSLWK
jgi:formate/nitrite transporter FocA (FNT family)